MHFSVGPEHVGYLALIVTFCVTAWIFGRNGAYKAQKETADIYKALADSVKATADEDNKKHIETIKDMTKKLKDATELAAQLQEFNKNLRFNNLRVNRLEERSGITPLPFTAEEMDDLNDNDRDRIL